MSDRYTLAEARAIIDAEKCERQEHDTWCMTHDARWSGPWDECPARPEVADVAAQLLATVERVVRLADDPARLSVHAGGGNLVTQVEAVPVSDLRDAINGEGVTE